MMTFNALLRGVSAIVSAALQRLPLMASPVHMKARMGELTTLAGFRISRVLREDPKARLLVLLGTFEGSEDQAVVLLQQKAFEQDKAATLLAGSTARRDLLNDIYTTYALSLAPEHCQVSCSITYPATDKHIQKWAAQTFRVVHETPMLYERVVLPHIESFPPERLNWVYNILEKKVSSAVWQHGAGRAHFAVALHLHGWLHAVSHG